MKAIPEFKTDEELAAWVDTHDTAAFLDDMEDVSEQFPVRLTKFATRPLDVRLRTDLYVAIEAVAERRGIPYQMLIQSRLAEKVRQEAPDLAVPQQHPSTHIVFPDQPVLGKASKTPSSEGSRL